MSTSFCNSLADCRSKCKLICGRRLLFQWEVSFFVQSRHAQYQPSRRAASGLKARPEASKSAGAAEAWPAMFRDGRPQSAAQLAPLQPMTPELKPPR
jgi:hypothetical protein